VPVAPSQASALAYLLPTFKVSISPHLTPFNFCRLELVCLLYYIVEKYLELAIFLLDSRGPCGRSLIIASRLE
jgi:hypothetical protein